MRRAHVIQANHGLESPWECIWLDTETTQHLLDFEGVQHRLWFGWAAYRRRLRDAVWTEPSWIRFSQSTILWDWIESLLHGRSRLYIFAHNAGFDLPVVDAFRELPRRGWELKRAVIDCPPVILRWRRGAHTLQCLDTLNIWRMPLDDLGRQQGIPKLAMPAPDASAEEWDAYCRRDVEVIMASCLSWFRFLQDNDFGSFAPTAASQAMRCYRHRFMRHELLVETDANALALSRAAYLGGVVECFTIGRVEEPVHRLDVNSMYPAVMRDNYYPTKLISTTRRASLDDLREWLRDACVAAEVVIATEEPAYPLLHDNKLVFPVGRFVTTLASPELAVALERRHIERVLHVAVYERAIIFRGFVEELWERRRAAAAAGDKVMVEHLKKLMNSFYGKWGQRGRVYREAGACDWQEARSWVEIDADTGEVVKHRTLGGLHQVFVNESESFNSMPCIAAHVTSYARAYLRHLIEQAGRENVHYCDTDSLHVSALGRERLAAHISPDRLGALKVERVEPWMEYFGLKDYRGERESKTKGVRKKAVWLDASTVVQQRWSTLVGLLADGDVSAPRTHSVVKHLARSYSKGVVEPSGRVSPLRILQEC